MAWSLLLVAALASSPSKPSAKAEKLTKRAIVEFNGGEFDDALADAKRAYAIDPVPGLLYNLGQIQRALHHWEEAAHEFRAYLRELPGAANRPAMEGIIGEMERNQRAQLAGEKPAPSPALTWGPPEASPGADQPLAVATPAKPEAKPALRVPRIAVLDIRPHGAVSQDIAQGVTAVTVLDIRRRAAPAMVVGADEIRTMVGFEHEKELLGCTEGSCIAEIGGALGAERLVLGSLSHFGDNYVLDLRLLDSRTAKVVAEGSARFKEEGALPDAVAQSVAELFAAAKPNAASSPGTVDTSPRPELTGETAPPHRTHVLAWSLFASGAIAAWFAIYGAVKVENEQSALSHLSSSTSAKDYTAAVAAQPNAQNWQVAAYALGGGALAAALGGVFTW